MWRKPHWNIFKAFTSVFILVNSHQKLILVSLRPRVMSVVILLQKLMGDITDSALMFHTVWGQSPIYFTQYINEKCSHLSQNLLWLTKYASQSCGQAISVDGHVINWNSCQCQSAASPCVPGVRVQRQTHDEEANHCEGDCDDQRHLWVLTKKSCVRVSMQGASHVQREKTLTLKGLGWSGKRYLWMSIPRVARAMKNQREKEAKLMSSKISLLSNISTTSGYCRHTKTSVGISESTMSYLFISGGPGASEYLLWMVLTLWIPKKNTKTLQFCLFILK